MSTRIIENISSSSAPDICGRKYINLIPVVIYPWVNEYGMKRVYLILDPQPVPPDEENFIKIIPPRECFITIENYFREFSFDLDYERTMFTGRLEFGEEIYGRVEIFNFSLCEGGKFIPNSERLKEVGKEFYDDKIVPMIRKSKKELVKELCFLWIDDPELISEMSEDKILEEIYGFYEKKCEIKIDTENLRYEDE